MKGLRATLSGWGWIGAAGRRGGTGAGQARRGGIQRRVGAFLTLVGLSLSVMMVVAPVAVADHVEPVLMGDDEGEDGNPSCADFTDGGTEFKIEEDDELQEVFPGESDHDDGTLFVTLDIYETEDGWEFDWETNFGVDVVVVKGGPNANVYFYDPIETSDTGLHSPLNPMTGQWYGLSHISFCYFPENAETTTTSTTSTTVVEETTLTTIEEEEETTTTVREEETTTTVEEETTTTVAEEEETTTTVEEETTTTAEVEVLPTVIEATTTTAEVEVLPTEVLPFTGSESVSLATLAAVLLLAGGALLWASARTEEG